MCSQHSLMSEHNESLKKEVIFEVENRCRKDLRLKAEKAHVQYFFGTKSPKYPPTPPHQHIVCAPTVPKSRSLQFCWI